MAVVYAIKNGNWSDGSTWNTGVVPTADDDVYLNGKTVSYNIPTPLNITHDVFFYGKKITNKSNDEYGIVEGGYVNQIETPTISQNIYINSDIDAVDNIFTVKRATIIVNGNIFSKTNTTGSSVRSTFYDAASVGSNTIANYEVNGNITTTEDSRGVVFDANSQYQSGVINGNVTLNGGYLAKQLYYALPTAGINGDLIINSGLNYTLNGNQVAYGKPIITGNIEIIKNNSSLNLSYHKIDGNVIARETTMLANTLNYAEINGDVFVYTKVGSYAVGNIQEATFNGNFYDYSTTPYFSNTNILTSVVNFNGDFHYGQHTYVGLNLQYAWFGELVFDSNGRFFTKTDSITFAVKWTVKNPNKFEFIYEGEGTPTFQVFPYGNNAFKYPQESDVKNNVVYGILSEYRGRYTPTILTDEQLQRIANCATMDEVAELSITIANKDNE